VPLQDEIRNEQLVAEIVELAVVRLAADLHVTHVQATQMLIGAAAQSLTPQGVSDALKSYRPPSINSLIA